MSSNKKACGKGNELREGQNGGMFGESTGPVGSAFLDIISLSEMALQGLILQLFSKLRGIILSFCLVPYPYSNSLDAMVRRKLWIDCW
jgi:hypothetical protein